MNILIAGGCGYIGSHTAAELIKSGHDIVICDSLIRGSVDAPDAIAEITGKKFSFYRVDISDTDSLCAVFEKHRFDAVIHFAGLKSVSESVRMPLSYYRSNVCATVSLLEVMERYNVRKIIFSSSASVYGKNDIMPLTEAFTKNPSNPYARSKSMIEDMIMDLCSSDDRWSAVMLRYFNPVGAHSSLLIGEDPKIPSDNIMPHIIKTALGEKSCLDIFGTDYDTEDGTGVRDYINISDLAKGHVCALERLFTGSGYEAFNLGTGKMCSVLELVRIFEESTGVNIPVRFSPRRPGDVSVCYADTSLAEKVLGWKAEQNLADMCSSSLSYAAKDIKENRSNLIQNQDGYR